MKHYINKDALVAEIEDWRDKIKKGIFSIPLSGNERAYAAFEYEVLGKVRDFIDTLEVKDDSLEKFKSLQHISGDLHQTLEDWGYAPNLYYFDGSWHVDWISCDGGDSIKDFTGDTIKEAVNKACNWFHSTFCNN